MCVDETGFPHFVFDIVINEDDGDCVFAAEFTIKKVVTSTEDNIPIDVDSFGSGSVKWDGCVNASFDDGGMNHFCRLGCWDAFSLLIFQIKSFLLEKGLIHD